MNNSDQAQEVTLAWDAEKLGLGGRELVRIEDYYTGGSWRLDRGKPPPLPLPARSFRMLVPEERQ
ncbi:MAG: hypothetical protein FJ279_38670 [Planctomycetes bacterium]|nr:hypothetical protein [Planctomycetota bacterium]